MKIITKIDVYNLAIECDECGEDKMAIASLGLDHAPIPGTSIYLCETCLRKALAMIEGKAD